MKLAAAIVVIDYLGAHQGQVVIVQEVSDPMTSVIVDLVIRRLCIGEYRHPQQRRKRCRQPD